MNILVIGGSGFIGTRLVEELVERGNKVTIFDTKKSNRFPHLVTLGDVRVLSDLIAATKDIDVIYNLAAEHRDDVKPLSLYHEVNVFGAQNIISAATENDVDKIVFTSTVAIYGLNKGKPHEDSIAEPFNEYGRTKLQAEQLFEQWYREDTTRSLIVFRPAVIFGEGNRGNVFNLISQIKSGRFIMIGNGQNKKSMGYVGNIANTLALQTDNNGHKIYNICDKPDLTSLEIVKIVRQEFDLKASNISLPTWAGLIAGSVLDLASIITKRTYPISKIRVQKFVAETTISTEKLLQDGYTSKFTLEEGIKAMIKSDFT